MPNDRKTLQSTDVGIMDILQALWQQSQGNAGQALLTPQANQQTQQPQDLNSAVTQEVAPPELGPYQKGVEKALKEGGYAHAAEALQSGMPADKIEQQAGLVNKPTNAFSQGGVQYDQGGNPTSFDMPGWFANLFTPGGAVGNQQLALLPGMQRLAGKEPLQAGQREAAISQALFELPNQLIEQEKAAAQAVPQLRTMLTAGEKFGTMLGVQPESLKVQKRIIQGSALGAGAALVQKLARIKELQSMQNPKSGKFSPGQTYVIDGKTYKRDAKGNWNPVKE